ncbi:hypothetical protein TgHK011_010132 [Trichoderma gracile]|nr:hypothetical protein TgHK011_010132 [Trichoderma gracile]
MTRLLSSLSRRSHSAAGVRKPGVAGLTRLALDSPPSWNSASQDRLPMIWFPHRHKSRVFGCRRMNQAKRRNPTASWTAIPGQLWTLRCWTEFFQP